MTRPKAFVRVLRFLFTALAVIYAGRLTPFAQAQTARTMALTFDDLPYVDVESVDVRNAERVTGEILRVLGIHNAPAVAFVNEAKLNLWGQTDARVAVLKQWADAGVVLGNHTYSHPDFNGVTIDRFEDEIIHGEVITRRLMESHAPYQSVFSSPCNAYGRHGREKASD